MVFKRILNLYYLLIMFRKQCHIKYKKYAVSFDFTAFSGLAFKKHILQNVTFFGIFYHKNGVENGVREVVIKYTKDDRRKAFGNIKG